MYADLMTETQPTSHRRPLAPGEIRMHKVGAVTFTVMHVAGGSFTQACAHEADQRSRVLKTDTDDRIAVNAYADAIEQAESDAIDAMEGDDTPEPLTAEGAEALAARAGFAPMYDVVTRSSDRTAVLDREGPMSFGDAVALADRAHAAGSIAQVDVEPSSGLYDKAIAEAAHFEEVDRAAVARGESSNWWERGTRASTPAPTLADDVAALRAKLLVTRMGGDRRDELIADLDRLAAREPQRATDASERGVWRHTCGSVRAWDTDPTSTTGCSWCYKPGSWQPLYVLPDGA